MPIATKVCRMVTYLEKLLSIKIQDTLTSLALHDHVTN